MRVYGFRASSRLEGKIFRVRYELNSATDSTGWEYTSVPRARTSGLRAVGDWGDRKTRLEFRLEIKIKDPIGYIPKRTTMEPLGL